MKLLRINGTTKKPTTLHILKKINVNPQKSGKVRSLVNINFTTSFNIKLLDKNNKLIIDPKKIPNIFNDHFSTLGSKIEQKIPFELGNYKDYFNNKDKNGNLFINSANSFFLSSRLVPMKLKGLMIWT